MAAAEAWGGMEVGKGGTADEGGGKRANKKGRRDTIGYHIPGVASAVAAEASQGNPSSQASKQEANAGNGKTARKDKQQKRRKTMQQQQAMVQKPRQQQHLRRPLRISYNVFRR